MVYEFDVSDSTACGRFMVPGPVFPRNAFRELTFSLRGDQTLYIRIISYDLWTLYLEGNVYKYGRWHHITLRFDGPFAGPSLFKNYNHGKYLFKPNL